MLHKCANPACTVPFRSLREGKLFLLTSAPLSTATGGSSAGVNISGCAMPARHTSRCVSTPPSGC